METPEAFSSLRSSVPDIRIRVVNVVDVMMLQLPPEHPHGQADLHHPQAGGAGVALDALRAPALRKIKLQGAARIDNSSVGVPKKQNKR